MARLSEDIRAAFFTNVIEVDDSGRVSNVDEAEHRAAQWIRRCCDPTYVVDPPFQDWEIELAGP
jgi:hypothetical protein